MSQYHIDKSNEILSEMVHVRRLILDLREQEAIGEPMRTLGAALLSLADAHYYLLQYQHEYEVEETP
jgi:hypothetical protein